jgi:hypothetical protein
MRRTLMIVAGLLGSATLAAPVTAQTPAPANYASGANWLCLPGRADACAVDLSATSVSNRASLRREEFRPASRPKVDCFYVYPTVSRDAGVNSDLDPGPEERRAVAAQFARFASVCRTFAPVYRQVTATALQSALSSGQSFPAYRQSLGYADVRAAWRQYMRNDNQGRGVVLIGDGQGADLLARLIAEEIDGSPDRPYLVSAILTGTTIRTPMNADVGGTFRSVPLCRSQSQTGCVITYSAYRAGAVSAEDAWYGRNGEDGVAACTNPADLKKGEGVADSYFVTMVRGWPLRENSPLWAGPEKPVGTPYVKTPGLVRTACVRDPGGVTLAVRVLADPKDARADDIGGDVRVGPRVQPEAGLSPLNIELHLGDLVETVGRQARAWRAPRR